jgi:hypothetical protein
MSSSHEQNDGGWCEGFPDAIVNWFPSAHVQRQLDAIGRVNQSLRGNLPGERSEFDVHEVRALFVFGSEPTIFMHLWIVQRFRHIFSPARLDERTRIEPGNAARAITRSDLALRCNCAMMVNSHRDSENRWTPLLGRICCPSRWLVPAFGNSFYSSQLRAQRSRKERASKCLRPPATRTSSSNLGTFGALTNLTQNKYLLRRATISYGRGSYRHAWLGLRQPRKSIHGLCRSRKKLGGPQARV